MLDEHLPLRAAFHAHLADVEVRRLVRGKEDVVVRGVAVVFEEVGREVLLSLRTSPF